MTSLRERLARHRDGASVGVTSVCSAHPLVIEAAAVQAKADGGVLLVEATSNQVDQYGGYTGRRPVDFAALVHEIVDRVGLPRVHLPDQYRRVRAGELPVAARALAIDHVRDVLRDYAHACGEIAA